MFRIANRSIQAQRWFIQARTLQGLTIGVPKESNVGEARVGLVPLHVAKLVKAGAAVTVQANAGVLSGFQDDEYTAAGATIAANEDGAWQQTVTAKVLPPTLQEAAKLQDRALVSIVQPRVQEDLYTQLATQGATVLSLDSLLRTLSRGQAYDVLSSQANVAGYRAVMEAGHHLQRPFSGQMTAAGKIAPAKVR
jgi:NAD(P) transhydrogenase